MTPASAVLGEWDFERPGIRAAVKPQLVTRAPTLRAVGVVRTRTDGTVAPSRHHTTKKLYCY